MKQHPLDEDTRERLRALAELTGDQQLGQIADLPEIHISLEHLRHLDPATRIRIGYGLDVPPEEGERLRWKIDVPPDPAGTLEFDARPIPGTPCY